MNRVQLIRVRKMWVKLGGASTKVKMIYSQKRSILTSERLCQRMRILAKRTLREFWESSPKYADAEDPLKSWYREAKQASWLNPAEVKEQYRNASILKNNRTVFNIAGNKYRLVVEINYSLQIIFIRFIGTHQAYDTIDVETI